MRHDQVRPTWLVIAGLLVLLAFACDAGDQSEAQDQSETGRSSGVGGAAVAGVADLVEEVAPSIVSVLAPPGQGSGVVYDSEGLVVTNAHVLAQGGDDVTVALADGRRLEADVVAADERSDLALLRLDADGPLPAATFEERLPRVGDAAVAIGTPLGLENSVTAGVVSGVDRSIPGAPAAGVPALVGLLQTDAALSPGSSGGALVDGNGHVIGVNVAFLPPELRAVSIGFAIPAGTVVDVVEQLLATGEVQHPFLGVQLVPLVPPVRERLDVAADDGAVVLAVQAGGPADAAGLEPGDVIVGLDGQDVRDPGDLLTVLRDYSPGDTVTVDIDRGGDISTVEVEVAERP